MTFFQGAGVAGGRLAAEGDSCVPLIVIGGASFLSPYPWQGELLEAERKSNC